ncbi:MAG: hypothetical protein AABY86_00235, partial [Bdellovibrionota bacterium]
MRLLNLRTILFLIMSFSINNSFAQTKSSGVDLWDKYKCLQAYKDKISNLNGKQDDFNYYAQYPTSVIKRAKGKGFLFPAVLMTMTFGIPFETATMILGGVLVHGPGNLVIEALKNNHKTMVKLLQELDGFQNDESKENEY